MPSSMWSGLIQLGRVQIPVKACTALDAKKSRISLNQLHDECHSRIRTKKSCPIHGELGNKDMVMGLQLSPGQYAVFTPAEINQLRSAADHTIGIDKFVPPGAIEPIYFSGTTYYLLPDGPLAQKLYPALHQAMSDERVWGLARAVIYNRDRLVTIRPIARLLGMSVLHYADTIRPARMFDAKPDGGPVSTKGLTWAKAMIGAKRTPDPRLDEYRDPYIERLKALIDAKIQADETSTPADDRVPPAGNANKSINSSGGINTRKLAEDALAAGPQSHRKAPVKRR